ncbi:MAG: T9SS type A sorting domain-containing protein [Ignavibacteria bacterium]|nr:T9SS type A sorting domain-containing protein [Ignavibacteria bacterium]
MTKGRLIGIVIFLPGIILSQWIQQYSGTNSFLSKVRMLDVNTGYVIGDSSHVLKTTNGGINWLNLNTGTTPNDYFTGIHFINSQTGYLCGGFMNGIGTSKILKTTNAGVNWIIQHQNGFEFYFAIHFINSETGFTGGYDGKFYKTTNGGLNWIDMYVTGVSVWTIRFLNQSTGFIAGDLGMLRRTTDCGQSWTLMPTGTNQRIASLFFTDYYNGYGVCDSEVVINTTNGGLNWTSQKLGTVIGYESVYFVNQSTGFAVGNCWEVATYKLIRTTNAGVNWHTLLQGEGDPYFDIFFANENTGWITGYNGLILKTTNGGSVFVKNISSEVPPSFSLSQNYPNPFNSSTNIKFNIPASRVPGGGNVTIKIFDLTGRIISTLVNEKLNPGTYELRFYAKDLPGGVYFYWMEADKFKETKKIILLK